VGVTPNDFSPSGPKPEQYKPRAAPVRTPLSVAAARPLTAPARGRSLLRQMDHVAQAAE
jgi:hypothetical protein